MRAYTKKTVCLLGSVLLMTACAGTYEPVVDMDGVNPTKYQQDLAVCRGYADKIDATGDGAKSTLIGAGLGAAAGAAIGAISGNAGAGALIGTTAGGFGGAGTSASDTISRQKTIINNCLKKRGYEVLG